ncbi:hypothetical protein CK500_14085 [Halorubrum salipaludis]|uniref:Uncharacterized protein n=1 Tax=Halorubrum salipaludis TaxID=2032630 RepID=A0A2A2FB46_9EURY|nr:hypothetical protein [Halorubrum salipaludis]PAU82721.1 hypothetical protein CK500_14085 [Halorubrum salipaludis]
MPDRPSDGDRQRELSAEADVDDEVQRRLREAYLNDAERELIVTGVRSAGREVVVEFRTPHGDARHTERFPAPSNGSLAESEAFVAFLEAVGVSPLDVDAVVGARVPATYEGGEWRLDESYLPDPADRVSDANAGNERAADRESARQPSARAREWLWTYRYWLFAALLVGGELLFVAVVIALYG